MNVHKNGHFGSHIVSRGLFVACYNQLWRQDRGACKGCPTMLFEQGGYVLVGAGTWTVGAQSIGWFIGKRP